MSCSKPEQPGLTQVVTRSITMLCCLDITIASINMPMQWERVNGACPVIFIVAHIFSVCGVALLVQRVPRCW